MRKAKTSKTRAAAPRRSASPAGAMHADPLASRRALKTHLLGATYDELLDTWVMTETLLVGMAARNPDRERVRAALTPFLDSHTDHDHATHEIAEGLQFHEVIASLADNRVLSYLLQAAGTIVTEHIVTTVDRKALEDHIVHEHGALAKAIIAGNANKAEQIMRDHIHHIAEYFREYWPRKIGEKIQWR
jgi:GntR family transcriptional regulator, transcriptional repressor for pyruvate dehydrogenase complex